MHEMRALVEVLDEIGFAVDVADYRVSSRMVHTNYDLYFGFGDALEHIAQNLRPNQKLIAYATGRAAPYQAAESMRRGLDYQRNYGTFPTLSLRIPSALWPWQIARAHGLIIIGDEANARTFDYYPAQTWQIRRTIRATYSTQADGFAIAQQRVWNSAKFNFLWFGGTGVVHKGLDLCIAAISQLPNVVLHVCGVSTREEVTVNRCLANHPGVDRRVKLYGFVHPHSQKFFEIAQRCAFVVLPSCSEGQATSVLTAVAGGGLIPILSDRCGWNDFPTPFVIRGLSVPEVVDGITNAIEMGNRELADIASTCVKYVREKHNIQKYKEKLREVVSEVIDESTKVRGHANVVEHVIRNK